MALFEKDPFGHHLYIKKWLIRVFGILTHQRYHGFNKLRIEGSDVIRMLPPKQVLFISNHQTYFADVAAMLHVFNASLSGRANSISNIGYLRRPKLNVYYVAARETMKSGLLPKILAYVGAVPVSRTWRESGKDIQRKFNYEDTENIGMAIEDGWVITFPQGTTKPWKPVRRGTAYLIKQYRPTVIPIVIDGFRRSFDKKGLYVKKKDVIQSMRIKAPLQINYAEDSIDDIIDKIQYAIEQHPSFIKVPEEDEYEEIEGMSYNRSWKY